MNPELVAIETETTPLDGLLYMPAGRPPLGAVQLMHGNTMNFYVGAPRFLPPALVELGFACLAYNRRGHDLLSNRDSRDLEGGAYQTIGEAIADNRIAREWLLARGLPPPLVIGHSNGGTLAVRHVADHPDTPGLVLLSAHRGGADLIRVASRHGLLAADRYAEITERALSLVDEGRDRELMLLPGWWYVISARTYVEYLTRCPDILELAPSVACPTLYVVGEEEPPELYPSAEFRQRAAGPVEVEVLAGCGHYYRNCEEAVTRSVVAWIGRNV